MQLGERGEEKEPIKFLNQKVLYTSPVFMRTEFTVIGSIPHTTVCPNYSLTKDVWGVILPVLRETDLFMHLPHLQLCPMCGFTAVLVDTFLYVHR